MCKQQVMITLDKDIIIKLDNFLKGIGFGSRSGFINKVLKDYLEIENKESHSEKINYLRMADDKLKQVFRK